ncbi:tmRNA [Chryseobacterium populi]|uniref:TmRNA n=1 Tax=Chryseobacterium populi TaxID=1144316 RepID=J2JJU4_9FLAO|nr:tmRNA [Chryseobacterium populi]
MNYSVGPFNLLMLISILCILYVCGIYFIMKKKLGIEAVLLMIFFPFIGSIGIIIYSLFGAKGNK